MMPRKFLGLASTFFLLLSSFDSYCQNEDSKRFEKPQYDHLKINTPKQKSTPGISITDIYVYDCRPDTTHIGLMYTSNPKAILLKLKDPLSVEVKKYYQLLLEPRGNEQARGELHCFIRRFTLSDMINVPLTDKEKNESSEKFDSKEESGVKIRMEFYIKNNNGFIPAWRFDSLCTGNKGVLKEGSQYMENALAASMRKIATLDWSRVLSNGKRLTWADISEYNKEAFNFAILSTKPQKGVFSSFEDFRNNKVTFVDFSVSRDDKGDFLYIKNKAGEETLLTELWGYSDGNDIFIYSANNFFRLFRSGNSFMFYGAKDYKRKRVMRLNFRLIDLANPGSAYSKERTRAKYSLEKDYLQLDWDTGELY